MAYEKHKLLGDLMLEEKILTKKEYNISFLYNTYMQNKCQILLSNLGADETAKYLNQVFSSKIKVFVYDMHKEGIGFYDEYGFYDVIYDKGIYITHSPEMRIIDIFFESSQKERFELLKDFWNHG